MLLGWRWAGIEGVVIESQVTHVRSWHSAVRSGCWRVAEVLLGLRGLLAAATSDEQLKAVPWPVPPPCQQSEGGMSTLWKL